jgi:hypothetical protein
MAVKGQEAGTLVEGINNSISQRIGISINMGSGASI